MEISRQEPVDQHNICQMQLLGIQDDQNPHSQTSHISNLKEELTKFATESPQISSLKNEIKKVTSDSSNAKPKADKVKKQDMTGKIEKMQEMKEEIHQIQEKTLQLSSLSGVTHEKMTNDLPAEKLSQSEPLTTEQRS